MWRCRKSCIIPPGWTYKLDCCPSFAVTNCHTVSTFECQLWEEHHAVCYETRKADQARTALDKLINQCEDRFYRFTSLS